MCEHHYHYLGTELHRLSPERDREDGGVRTEERRASRGDRDTQSVCPIRETPLTVHCALRPGLGTKHPASLATPHSLSRSQTRPDGSLDRSDIELRFTGFVILMSS